MDMNFWVVGWKPEIAKEYAFSCHASLAEARAKISWEWQRKEPSTVFQVWDCDKDRRMPARAS